MDSNDERRRVQAPWTWTVLFLLAAAGPLWLPAVAESGTPDEAAMTAAWMRAGTPGDHHAHLAALVGTWNVEGSLYLAPDAPPAISKGTMKARMVLGGRYLASHWETDFQGQPFEGLAMDGWDNLMEKYVGQWWDNLSTQTLLAEGSCSQGGRVRTMTTTGIDPMTGQTFRSRGVTTVVDDDHWTFVSWRILPDGGERKEMEWSGVRAAE